MKTELIAQRRQLLKKRFISSMIQLYAVLAVTAYNCVAEIVLPGFVLPVSFYIPQFIASYAKFLSKSGESRALFSLLVILSFMLVLFIAFCLIFARRNYKLLKFINVIASVDIIMLIYFGISTLFTTGWQPFFVINIFLHIWILFTSATACRASEGLEVLPESDEESDSDD